MRMGPWLRGELSINFPLRHAIEILFQGTIWPIWCDPMMG